MQTWQTAKMAGISRRVAGAALNAVRKAAALLSWEKQEEVETAGAQEFDEHSTRTIRVGVSSTYHSCGGLNRRLQGPGRAYVRHIGSVGRAPRESALYKLPAEITTATQPGTGVLVSLGEVIGSGVLGQTLPASKPSSDSAKAYKTVAAAQVNHKVSEWTRWGA